ncbi:winged helix-turn-helix transcriptional regulator [Promicromonospora sp. NPDC060204]|uniref:winged helix-turn-helix transcriptional regulator n=1 Tax=Promicromonospora sp. NPDC060204 TaxID=3347071 RepID=UPI00365FE420
MAMHLSSTLSDEGDWRGRLCPIDNAASVIGSRPTLLIVREAFYGTTRFDDFVTHTRLTTAVVSSRLKLLVENSVLEPRPYREPRKRTRNEYVLTEHGSALLPLVLALMQWGSDHVLHGGPVRANDTITGKRLVVGPRDNEGSPITADRVAITPNSAWQGQAD